MEKVRKAFYVEEELLGQVDATYHERYKACSVKFLWGQQVAG